MIVIFLILVVICCLLCRLFGMCEMCFGRVFVLRIFIVICVCLIWCVILICCSGLWWM